MTLKLSGSSVCGCSVTCVHVCVSRCQDKRLSDEARKMALSVAFQYYHILCRMADLREMTPEAIEGTMVCGLVLIKSPAEALVLSKQRKKSHHVH